MSAPGRAQLPVLEWEAAPGCPDVQAVRDALQRAVEPSQLARVRAVRASVERTDTQYRLELELQTDGGSQRSERFAELCCTFVDLLVLELGLWAAPHDTPQQPGADSGVPTAWGVRLTGVVGSGPTPAPAPGIALALALARRRLRLELAAIYAFPQTKLAPRPSSVAVEPLATSTVLLPTPAVQHPGHIAHRHQLAEHARRFPDGKLRALLVSSGNSDRSRSGKSGRSKPG